MPRVARALLTLVTTVAVVLVGVVTPAASAVTPSISGVVLGVGGAAAQGNVIAYSASGMASSRHVAVGPDGTFAFSGLTASVRYAVKFSPAVASTQLDGWYVSDSASLSASRDSAAEIAPGGTRITLRPKQGRTLRGRVEVPPGAQVDVAQLDISAQPEAGTARSESWLPDGTFEIRGLLPGVALTVWLAGGTALIGGSWTADGTLTQRGEPGLVAPDVDEIVLRPLATGFVDGTVEPPPGVSLPAKLAVRAWSAGGTPARPELQMGAVTVRDGHFHLDGFEREGQVFLALEDASQGVVAGFIGDSGRVVRRWNDASAFAIGATVELLADPARTITGRVLLPEGYVHQNTAQEHPTKVAVWEQHDEDGEGVPTTVDLQNDGSFRIGGLRDSDFRVQLWDSSRQLVEGYLADIASGRLSSKAADAVSVPSGGGPLTLSAVAARAITGRVVNAPGSDISVAGPLKLTDADDPDAWPWVAAGADPDGFFATSRLDPSRRYYVQYLPHSGGLLGGYYAGEGKALVRNVSDAVAVTPGAAPLTLHARATAAMSGRVILPEGFAASDLELAYDEASQASLDNWFYGIEVAPDGTFRTGHLDPDKDYVIRWWSSGASVVGGFLGAGGRAVETVDKAILLRPTNDVVVRPERHPSVTGKVQLPPGVDVDHTDLTVYAWPGGLADVAEDGTFEIPHLRPWDEVSLHLRTSDESIIDGYYTAGGALVEHGDDAGHVRPGTPDIVLRPQAAAEQSGTVRLPDGSPVEGALVSARRAHITSYTLGSAGRTDADGRFTVGGLVPGSSYVFEVDARAVGATSGHVRRAGPLAGDLDLADRFTVPGTSMNIVAEPTTSIVVSAPVEPPLAAPVTVRAFDEDGVARASATLGTSGTATLGGLAQGRSYQVSVGGGGVAPAWYAGEGQPWVTRAADAERVPAPARVGLGGQTAATSLSGRMLPAQAGKAGYYLDLVDPGTGARIRRVFVSATDGSFVVNGLPPGTYKVAVNLGSGSTAPSFYGAGSDGRVDFADASLVTLEPGQTTAGIDLANLSCASYSGGLGLGVPPHARVEVTLASAAPGAGSRTWVGSGRSTGFTVHGLVPATYRVTATTVLESGRTTRQFADTTITGCEPVTGARLGDLLPLTAVSNPVVSGTVAVGSPLTVTGGTWSAEPDELRYQWTVGGRVIAGATSATYVPRPDDLRSSLAVQVVARRSGHVEVSTTVAADGLVERGVASPPVVAVTGTPKVGAVVSGTATGLDPDALIRWTWQRDGWTIADADASTYRVSPQDAGSVLTATATVLSAGFVPTSGQASTAKVAFALVPWGDEPRLPTRLTVGKSAQINPGTWSAVPDSFAYQWMRAGVAIPGATAQRYLPVAEDLGKVLTVRVKASLAGRTTSVTTPGVKVEPGTITVVSEPTLPDSVRVGDTVRPLGTTWSTPGVTWRYQWLRNGSPIPGATTQAYVVRATDVQTTLAVRISATKPGYTSGSAVARFARPVARSVSSLRVTYDTTSGGRIRVTVYVTAPGVRAPVGRIRARVDGGAPIDVALRAEHKGVVVVGLGALSPGDHRVGLTFEPTGATARATLPSSVAFRLVAPRRTGVGAPTPV